MRGASRRRQFCWPTALRPAEIPGPPSSGSHLLAPLALLLAALVLVSAFDVDMALARWFYAVEGHQWSLTEHFVPKILLHRLGCWLVAAAFVATAALYATACWQPRLMAHREGLGRLLLSMGSAVLIVGALKRMSPSYCPWNLLEFGGNDAFRSLLDASAWFDGHGQCWPAAHSGGAFALLGLYFFCRVHAPAWRFPVLATMLALGTIYGITQQLRGAHFLSHDIASLGVCWLVNLAYWRRPLPAPSTASPRGAPQAKQVTRLAVAGVRLRPQTGSASTGLSP